MKLACPNCGKQFRADENLLPKGKVYKLKCPACKIGSITVDRKTTTSGYAPPPPPKVETPRKKKLLYGPDLKKRVIANLEDLPPMPQVVNQAHRIMSSPNLGLKELAGLLETDQAIVAKVLRMGNSAYYGLSGKISSVHQACVLLGQKALVEVIIFAGVSQLLGKKLSGYDMNSGDLWRHSLATSLAAQFIAKKISPEVMDDATVAGLIHDAGKMILDPFISERKDAFVSVAAGQEELFLNLEKKVLGVDHCEIGAEACKVWQIPAHITDAVRYHHNPGRGTSDLAYIVHLADYVALSAGIGLGRDDLLHPMSEDVLVYLNINEEDLNNILVDVIEAVTIMEEEVLRAGE